ncbi:hypothetical protein [Massilia sp. LjRoot122]
MKTLATHPDLVRAWLLALAGMPLPPAAQPATAQAGPHTPPPVQPYRR